MPLSAGDRLGRYEVLAPLGAGGMGEVYRARDTRLDREVALKILPELVAADPDRLARFDREAKAVAALSHPNILALYDAGTERGVTFCVTELLEGETLRARLGHGALPARRAIEIAIQIARGLAAAHAKVVHRDLKPENVFLVADGQVKILDFGLAKTAAPAGSQDTVETATNVAMTEAGVVLGTVGYMAPEQVRSQAIDGRADLFALGAVLYEMVAGRRAFQRDTSAETMTAILREEPPDLTAAQIAQAPALDRIIRHCLEKNPAERFQSARDIVFALEAISRVDVAASPASGGTSQAPATVPTGTASATATRSRRGMLIGAAVALVVVIGVAIGGWALTGRSGGGIDKIGVLPIEDISGKDEVFVAAMHDNLTNALARLRQAGVESRSTMMRYKGGAKSNREIAKELALDAVVEMTVFRAGDVMRVNVQFTDPVTSRSLWSDTYEQNVKDVLAAQGEVVAKIATGIGAAMTARQ
jgi:TolB-like protein